MGKRKNRYYYDLTEEGIVAYDSIDKEYYYDIDVNELGFIHKKAFLAQAVDQIQKGIISDFKLEDRVFYEEDGDIVEEITKGSGVIHICPFVGKTKISGVNDIETLIIEDSICSEIIYTGSTHLRIQNIVCNGRTDLDFNGVNNKMVLVKVNQKILDSIGAIRANEYVTVNIKELNENKPISLDKLFVCIDKVSIIAQEFNMENLLVFYQNETRVTFISLNTLKITNLKEFITTLLADTNLYEKCDISDSGGLIAGSLGTLVQPLDQVGSITDFEVLFSIRTKYVGTEWYDKYITDIKDKCYLFKIGSVEFGMSVKNSFSFSVTEKRLVLYRRK